MLLICICERSPLSLCRSLSPNFIGREGEGVKVGCDGPVHSTVATGQFEGPI